MIENISNPIFHNETKAREYLEQLRWGDNSRCPHCDNHETVKPTTMKNKPTNNNPEPKPIKGYYHCSSCRKKFTVRTGSIYERSHIPLHKWVLATYLMSSSKSGMSAHQLHRMLGVTYKSAWFMSHRIREALTDDDLPPIGGDGESVQADETYFGQRDTVKKRTKKGRPSHSSKMSVVSLVNKGKSRTFQVERADSETISRILNDNVDKHTELHTDESRLYSRVGRQYVAHKMVHHTSGEHMNSEGIHTNNVENFFSVFKRGMRGVYQHCTEKHLQRYITEFDFRYNTRKISDFDRSRIAMSLAEGKRLMYRDTLKTKKATTY